jgi:hypothetical protein
MIIRKVCNVTIMRMLCNDVKGGMDSAKYDMYK